VTAKGKVIIALSYARHPGEIAAERLTPATRDHHRS
jgi:hypothetical protein